MTALDLRHGLVIMSCFFIHGYLLLVLPWSETQGNRTCVLYSYYHGSRTDLDQEVSILKTAVNMAVLI